MRWGIWISALVVACSCAPQAPQSAELVVDRLEPQTLVVGQRTPVEIVGRGFTPDVRVSFDSSGSTLDAVFGAHLGGVALEDVTRISSRRLRAIAPPTLAVGFHPLTLSAPGGRSLVIADAAQVIASASDGGPQGGDRDGDARAMGDSTSGDAVPPGDTTSTGDTSTPGDTSAPGDTAPEDLNCSSGNCDLECPLGGCTATCTGQAGCQGTCSGNCDFVCAGQASCDFQCDGNCTASCSGNADCTLTCITSTCSFLACNGNASCTLIQP